MKNLGLLIASVGLTIIFGAILILFGVIYMTCLGKVSTYYLRLAIAIDTFGNVLGYPLFNLIFIKKDGYKFGNRRDTISYVLGINKRDGKLWGVGITLSWLLNKLDKNHLEKAIGIM